MTADNNLTKAQLLQQLESLRAEHEKTEKSLAGHISRAASMRTQIDAMHELRRKDDKFYSEEKAKYKEHLKKTVIALASIHEKLGDAVVAMGTAVTADEYIAAIKTVGVVRAEAVAALDKNIVEDALRSDSPWLNQVLFIAGFTGLISAVYGTMYTKYTGNAATAPASPAASPPIAT